MDERTYDDLKVAPKHDIEVSTRRVRRRRWSEADKLAIVRESLEPGALVAVVARRYDVSTGLLYTWRRILLGQVMSAFVPVTIGPECATEGSAPAVITDQRLPDGGPAASAAAHLIEIVIGDGRAVRVGADVDEAALVRVLRALGAT
jgi:transposase